jgi:hypothetical protein
MSVTRITKPDSNLEPPFDVKGSELSSVIARLEAQGRRILSLKIVGTSGYRILAISNDRPRQFETPDLFDVPKPIERKMEPPDVKHLN